MNFVTVDSPLDPELRREQLEGLGLPPRLDLPAEQPELRHRRRLEVVDDVTRVERPGLVDRPNVAGEASQRTDVENFDARHEAGAVVTTDGDGVATWRDVL